MRCRQEDRRWNKSGESLKVREFAVYADRENIN
jgi:hypothetical protein